MQSCTTQSTTPVIPVPYTYLPNLPYVPNLWAYITAYNHMRLCGTALKDSVEGQPDKIAHRQLMLSLAGIHTTTMSITHAIYDLCAHPDYFEPLRSELRHILDNHGGWKRPIIPIFKKLDSFLKESQRMNPPALSKYKSPSSKHG